MTTPKLGKRLHLADFGLSQHNMVVHSSERPDPTPSCRSRPNAMDVRFEDARPAASSSQTRRWEMKS